MAFGDWQLASLLSVMGSRNWAPTANGALGEPSAVTVIVTSVLVLTAPSCATL